MTGGACAIRVIGIGNRDRGDDGIGPWVAERLAGRVPAGVSVSVRDGDALALIEDWPGAAAAILVDAAAPMTAPATIHRIDLTIEVLPPGLSPASTHALSISQAVGLARELGVLPARCILFAIEGSVFDAGAPLTSAVVVAGRRTIELVLDEIGRLRDVREECPA